MYDRFDLYQVLAPDKQKFEVIRLCHGVPFRIALTMAGVEEQDFTESVANTGWCGTCPEWARFLAIVAVPHGELLAEEHLDFMVESIEQV